MATNWDDPCEAAAALRVAYFNAMSGGGGQIVSVRFSDREVKYSSDPGSIAALREELARQEALCAVKNGETPKRHAIKFGAARRCY